jgi:hypothetical protein
MSEMDMILGLEILNTLLLLALLALVIYLTGEDDPEPPTH